jgi:penicillin amidase
MAPYLASLELQRARTWDDFLAALNRWGLPGENLVYADTDGTIGWKPAGRTPRRRGWDGLLPVPGDGRFEWDGYHDGDELPVERNPERGWVATANQMNVPAGFPRAFGYEWAPPFRYRRIAEALDANPRWSVEDAVALQTDVVSLPARILVGRLEGLAGADERQRRALALLAGWDHRLDRSSAAAALFEVWKDEHFPAAFWKRAAQARGLSAEAAKALEGSTINALFAAIESEVLDPAAMREVLLASLGEAAGAVEEKLGPDWTAWTWGDLHHSRFDHPLSALLRERLAIEPDVGPLPRGGSGETPNATSYRSSDFRQEAGASVRVVLDVGNWDASRAMNTPGQSGVPGSPHYRDLFPSWAADESFPFLWTRERIEAETVRRIRLEPR